jgi:hypothetical protein
MLYSAQRGVNMKKNILLCIIIIVLIATFAVAEEVVTEDILDESPDLYEEEFDKLTQEDIYENIDVVKIQGKPGLSPDSAFYFLDTLIENVLVGDNPETALKYKEEKVLELELMVKEGNNKGAEKALRRLEKYNTILKKEVNPDMDLEVRRSSKATKNLLNNLNLDGEEWEGIKEDIDENIKVEDRIALAAKVSGKIKGLCQALSKLDPLEYSKVCKTDDNAPKWKRDLDEELTTEQAEEAREFFAIMSQCFQNPAECRCDDISVAPFAEQCKIIAPLAAACESGDDTACEKMEEVPDPIDLLPDYLQDVMDNLEDDLGESKHDLHIPKECEEEGANSREACMRVMFKLNAPPECLEALDSGKINPSNEKEARQACEEIMFNQDAPKECIEAGLKDRRECDRLMFKLDSPEECIEAGLTGSGRDDWKKCDQIRFKLDAPKECIDAGITGENRDDWKKCESIKFRMDSPKECIDAGLDGSGRDDWKKCDAIKFKLDAPDECISAGLDGSGRDDWRKCDVIRFKTEAHPDCLAAGLDGTGRNDWKECGKIQFKADASQECLDAGLDGSGRDDWKKCEEISGKHDDLKGSDIQCGDNELHICDEKGCHCISKEDYDRKQGFGDDDEPYPKPGDNHPDNGVDCAVIYCGPESDCKQGVGCVPKDNSGPNECKDGCNDECPDADKTSCIDNRCECYYDQKEDDNQPEMNPEDDQPDTNTKDDSSDDSSGEASPTPEVVEEPKGPETDNSDSGTDDSDSENDDSSSDDSNTEPSE